MAGFTHLAPDDETDGLWDMEGGVPTVSHFGNAIQVWAVAQDNDVTINDAAVAFNVRPALVEQAVDVHPYMAIGKGGIIEHDGE